MMMTIVVRHKRRQEFLQEAVKSTSCLSSPFLPHLSILLLPPPSLSPTLFTLPFILCCEADALNTAGGLTGERCTLPQWGPRKSPVRNRN